MEPAMKHDALTFLCIAALFGAASGLTVGPVRLFNNSRYISYELEPSANNSLIECPYHLDEGQVVSQVYWEMWDDVDIVGTYEWRPGIGGGNATGRLDGVVKVNRNDGELELTKLRYDLGGEYSCSVRLTNDETKKSNKEEVLIIDTIGASTHSGFGHGCVSTTSYKSPTVFPEPTVRAGMFSKDLNDFYEEVSGQDWRKIVYSNGSVTYTYNNVSFKVDENTPEDIMYKLEMGVTKSDGKYISLGSFTSYSEAWNEHGCQDVKEENNKEVNYFPGFNTVCRGGRKNRTKATMTCKRGYRPAGPVRIVVMRCNGTSLTWEPEEGLSAATFEDLECVVDNSHGDGRNKEVVSTGNPNLALLSTALFGVVFILFDLGRP